jgi:hypothetical protein
VLLIGAIAAAAITVSWVTCKPERDLGLSVLESNEVPLLGKIQTAQGTDVPGGLVQR